MRTIDKLAVDGGTPVRTTPLPTGKGLAVFGDEERAAALEVLESRSLFRYYGPNLLGKVSAFEAAARELLGATHAVPPRAALPPCAWRWPPSALVAATR